MRYNRFNLLFFFVLLASAIGLVSPQAVRAEDAEIKTALAAHHAAIEARNIAQLASVWLQTPAVTLVNPRDNSVAVGWSAVRSRWERVFDIVDELKISQADGPHVDVSGDVAWSVGFVHVVEHFRTEGTKQVDLVETDTLVRHAGRWLIASHTARPI